LGVLGLRVLGEGGIVQEREFRRRGGEISAIRFEKESLMLPGIGGS